MAPRRTYTIGRIVLAIAGSAALSAPAIAAEPSTAIYRGVSTAVHFDVSPPLSELALRPPTVASTGNPNRDRPTGLERSYGPQDVDPLVQRESGSIEIPAPSVGFNTFTNTSLPPDPNGAVGPNHYVVMANSVYAVYSKTGTQIIGPTNINTIWAGFGGACQNENAGDPVVLYDRQNDRWLLTQFTAAGPTFFNCVALSQTGNPAGAYYRWAFTTGTNFPDYPKYGIWSDAYYISTREFAGATFAGVGAYALNRAQMLVGNPAPQVISFLQPPGGTPYIVGDGLLPSDLDGSTLPPAGRPNFYIGTQDNGGPYGAPSDAINIFRFHVDFAVPGNSTFTGPTVVPVGAFDSILNACGGGRDCIPQSGTAQLIDHLGYRQRPLHRAAYRNFGTHEAIVTNQSVEAAGGISGIRWWEVRSPNASPTIFQEGTYAPGDGVHRWMGSIAQDKQGNMALGFSVSNASIFPGIRYTGRLVGDPLGTLPQGEGTFVNGAGSQTTGNRWGDYTAMTIDPTDDCTFWYVNEYLTANGGTKTLRVGAFKYPSCAPTVPSNTVSCTVASQLGDFNGDARNDLLFKRISDGLLTQYLMNGINVQSFSVLGMVGPEFKLIATADFNGDGRADMLFRRISDGLLTLYLMNGPTVQAAQAIGMVGPEWDFVGAADVNGDGRADIMFRRASDGLLSLYLMNGFTVQAAQLLGIVGQEWRFRALRDFNGDGRADMLFKRASDGMLSLYLMNGFTIQQAGLIGMVGPEFELVGARDFNGDGRADMLFRRAADGLLTLYLMNGFTVQAAQALGTVGTEFSLIGVGDLNGDAKSDMVFRRNTDGVLSIYLMDGFNVLQNGSPGMVGPEFNPCYGQPPT